jgi:flagellar hook-associated protein 3 FlgL
MSLTVQADKTEPTMITEQLTNAALSTKTVVTTGGLKEINEGNFTTIDTTEYDVTTNDIYRIRLSYSDVDVDSNNLSIKYTDSTGIEQTITIPDQNKVATATDEIYLDVVNDPDAIYYVADTGEILLGSNYNKELSELSSDTEIRVTYDKSNWSKGDLDPVHYFYTVRNGIEYNKSFLDDPSSSGKQIIEYDVGNNQTIRVNTTADEVFTHDMGRDADEVIEMLNEYSSLEDTLSTVQDLIDSEKYSGEDLTTLETQKAAIEKAMTYVGDKINNRCSELLTNCDNYANRTSLAETNCGSRGTRLDLIQNRLSSQQTSFKELVSENEDADYTDLAIQLKSIQLTYEAALSSISYIMQTTLLDFI